MRQDFPCLHQQVNGQNLVFLDSAASAQKPRCVLEALQQAYSQNYANVHRGMYYLSELATAKFEDVRKKVAAFIGAASFDEIVFTKGATEAINLVAQSYGGLVLRSGDEIIISVLEHHANIVPWQQIAMKTGAKLRVVPVNDECELNLDSFKNMLVDRTKIVAMLHVSNAVGTVVPIKSVIELAHQAGAVTLVDASQSIVHQPIDVQELDADFLVFSGHKLYGPNGTGVLYGKAHLLELMPPYQTGGEMVDQVSLEFTTFRAPPLRFEAGTPIIAEVIALGAALDYISEFDRQAIMKHEQQLHDDICAAISELKKFRIIGRAKFKAPIISFLHETAHPSDIGAILDQCGIAIRAGNHCAQPLMQRLGLSATARASVAMYNTHEDVRALINGLHKVTKLFA